MYDLNTLPWLNHLLDLIGKEELTGEELAIVLNHLIENIDLTLLNDKYRELSAGYEYGDLR